MAVQFVLPLFRCGSRSLYVSAWYIIGGDDLHAARLPGRQLRAGVRARGAQGATYSGLWIHDAVGLYVTPFAVAIFYVVIPTVTGRPIYSHFLSMLAFWMLFFIYPLNGTHHLHLLVDPDGGPVGGDRRLGLPRDGRGAERDAICCFRCRGSAAWWPTTCRLRFVWVGVVAYLAVSLQGSLQALMPVNRLVHFTDWVIGHSHFAMIGFASFAAVGGLLHVWKQTPGLRYNARAANWAFWLLATGLALMVADLTAAGMVQGQLWQSRIALDRVGSRVAAVLDLALAGGAAGARRVRRAGSGDARPAERPGRCHPAPPTRRPQAQPRCQQSRACRRSLAAMAARSTGSRAPTC